MKLIAIAAIGRHRELGLHGDMPWKRSLKQDLQFFRQQTSGHPIVMGRHTLESLPGLLPGRKHLLITSHPEHFKAPIEAYASVEDFLHAWKDRDETVYLIGGGQLYASLLPYCDALILTEIDAGFPADTWFPTFDSGQYEKTILDDQEDGGYHTRHILYERK